MFFCAKIGCVVGLIVFVSWLYGWTLITNVENLVKTDWFQLYQEIVYFAKMLRVVE